MSGTRPAEAVRLPDGSRVRGRGLRRAMPEGPPPEWGLYLGSPRLRRRHDSTLTWPHEWINWPDLLVPLDRDSAVAQIRAAHGKAREGRRVEVACNGGIGRTGTVIACMAVLAGIPPGEAVAWTRANYHRRAVETPWQRRWVTRFPQD